MAKLCKIAGLLLLAAALCLTGFNLHQQQQAGSSASAALDAICSLPVNSEVPDTTVPLSHIPQYLREPEMEMPIQAVNGQEYIGILEIPALELRLPILSQWSYPQLQIAPCRYQGSAYLNNLILMAHNYQTHFGKLGALRPGDLVCFTDMEGNGFRYEVVEIEDLAPDAVEEMTTGEWDLTLFTCTLGGRSRVTVRCQRCENEKGEQL